MFGEIIRCHRVSLCGLHSQPSHCPVRLLSPVTPDPSSGQTKPPDRPGDLYFIVVVFIGFNSNSCSSAEKGFSPGTTESLGC